MNTYEFSLTLSWVLPILIKRIRDFQAQNLLNFLGGIPVSQVNKNFIYLINNFFFKQISHLVMTLALILCLSNMKMRLKVREISYSSPSYIFFSLLSKVVMFSCQQNYIFCEHTYQSIKMIYLSCLQLSLAGKLVHDYMNCRRLSEFYIFPFLDLSF